MTEKTFSLGLLQKDVQKQFAVSRELLELVQKVSQSIDRVQDDNAKRQLNDVMNEILKISDELADNAKTTGDEVLKFVTK